MINQIVNTSLPVTLVGGGESSPADIGLSLALAPVCIAADGGAQAVLEAGHLPEAVVGDMDSIPDTARAQIPPERMHLISEQDSTDFDKALRSIDAPLVIAVGFAGGRIDHELATLNTLVARPDRRVLVLTREDVVFLCPRYFALDVPAGTRVSLFPMGPVTGRSAGLQWPIDGLDFAPGVRSGTSNRAICAVRLDIDAPLMLCILPRTLIQPVVSALLALPGRALWPARAERHRAPRQP